MNLGARSRQRGFTLIELMVALLVSTLLVGMILAIFSRMSLAYRGQQQISGVQQILAAARAAIQLDAKQAGLGMPQGFKTAIPGAPLQSPVQVINASTGPDQIALFYADPSIQAQLTQATPVIFTSPVTFDDVSAFTPLPMLVVLTTSSTASSPLSTPPSNPLPDIATYDACVLQITAVNTAARQVTFSNAAPWGTSFAHCTNLVTNRTMMYRFVAHAYRIDPTPARLPFGALQQSLTGNLLRSLPGNLEVWTDLAYGFSDIQTAVRIYDPSLTATDLDSDTDAHRNWYSGPEQQAMTDAAVGPSGPSLLGMSISLVAHTDRNVEGIATAATPDLNGPPNVDHNSIGDRPAIALPAAPADPLLPGQRIYRWTTFQVDFRNLGVGVAP